MAMLSRSLPRLVLAALCAAVLATPCYARKSRLSPAKVKQIKKAYKSYEVCRRTATARLKQGSLTSRGFAAQLSACKENFPGAGLYTACKRQALQTARSRNLAPDKAVRQCKRYLIATQFDPQIPVPFFVDAGQLYFAGIGLNHSLPVSQLKPPNFECDKLKQVAHNPVHAQYFLFGNHPRTFAALASDKGSALVRALKIHHSSSKGIDSPGFGRIFGDPRSSSATVFFPSSSCDFDAEPGNIYAGLSAYYLLDASGSTVTPYFGIAYYRQDQKKVTTQKLVSRLLHTLGPGFKAYSKNRQVTFIAAASLGETDEEQDPKNLCRQPRQHRFIGVVQSQRDNPSQPEYMILASVKNLCDFGDRMAKRLVE